MIKTNIQEMQDEIRTANETLERAERCGLSRRMRDGVDRFVDRGRDLSQRTELHFREWTVHLAGEPMERHRKKPSYEKLQRAFEEEVMHLKAVMSRASAVQETGVLGSRSSECQPMCGEQEPSIDMGIEEDQGLLCNFESQQLHSAREEEAIQARIVAERDDGIRRIQSQTAEVNQMFRDLAAVVTEQGQKLESIDQQAESSSQITKETIQELKKTAKRQTNTRENLCYMLMGAILFLCVLILPHMRMSTYTPHVEPASISSIVGNVRILRGAGVVTTAGASLGASVLGGVSGATETVRSLGGASGAAETISGFGEAPSGKPGISEAPAAKAPGKGIGDATSARPSTSAASQSPGAAARQAPAATTLSPRRAADSVQQRRLLETAAPAVDQGDPQTSSRAAWGFAVASKVISKTGHSLK